MMLSRVQFFYKVRRCVAGTTPDQVLTIRPASASVTHPLRLLRCAAVVSSSTVRRWWQAATPRPGSHHTLGLRSSRPSGAADCCCSRQLAQPPMSTNRPPGTLVGSTPLIPKAASSSALIERLGAARRRGAVVVATVQLPQAPAPSPALWCAQHRIRTSSCTAKVCSDRSPVVFFVVVRSGASMRQVDARSLPCRQLLTKHIDWTRTRCCTIAETGSGVGASNGNKHHEEPPTLGRKPAAGIHVTDGSCRGRLPASDGGATIVSAGRDIVSAGSKALCYRLPLPLFSLPKWQWGGCRSRPRCAWITYRHADYVIIVEAISQPVHSLHTMTPPNLGGWHVRLYQDDVYTPSDAMIL
jgi:hypothetical protein